MSSEATLDAKEAVTIKRVANGWVLIGVDSEGEEWQVCEAIKVDDAFQSEAQHEQECMAFVEVLKAVTKMVGPIELPNSRFSVKIGPVAVAAPTKKSKK